MTIFRKKLNDFEWLSAILPLLNVQKKLIEDFSSAMSAQSDSENAAETFLHLYTQTRQGRKELNKVGKPSSSLAKEADKSFRKTMKHFETATGLGRKYFHSLAGGLLERSLSEGITARFSSSSLVFQNSLFYGVLEEARKSLDISAGLIDNLEAETMATTVPSTVISQLRYGREIINRIEGIAEILDEGFQNWDPPYEPLDQQLEYENDEQTEINKARDVCQKTWAPHLDSLLPEYREAAYEEWVVKPGVAGGLIQAATIRCQHNGDHQGALNTWLKWFTHRSQSTGWGLNPEAWVLLTEIYTGLQDIPTAKQVFRFAVMLAAQDLEAFLTYPERETFIKEHLVSECSAKLGRLQQKIIATDSP